MRALAIVPAWNEEQDLLWLLSTGAVLVFAFFPALLQALARALSVQVAVEKLDRH